MLVTKMLSLLLRHRFCQIRNQLLEKRLGIISLTEFKKFFNIMFHIQESEMQYKMLVLQNLVLVDLTHRNYLTCCSYYCCYPKPYSLLIKLQAEWWIHSVLLFGVWYALSDKLKDLLKKRQQVPIFHQIIYIYSILSIYFKQNIAMFWPQ